MKFNAICICLLLFFPKLANAQTPEIVIGVVSEGSSEVLSLTIDLIESEVEKLVKGEFSASLPRSKRISGQWSKEGISSGFEKLYADPEVDMVLALGFVTAAVAVSLEKHLKPTFATIIIDDQLVGAPRKGSVSGKKNLSYVTIEADFKSEIEAFLRVVKFDKLTVVGDKLMTEAVPQMSKMASDHARSMGIALSIVDDDGSGIASILRKIPADTDAVMIGGLPRMSMDEIKNLIAGLNQKKFPTYGLMGSDLVKMGALAASMPAGDWNRRARRVALNIHAVLLGEKAADLKVAIATKRRLTINMDTARAIDISPSFDLLLDSEVLASFEGNSTVKWTLSDVAKRALSENQQVRASKFAEEAGGQSVKEARARLFPQLNASTSYATVNGDTAAVNSGMQAEQQGVVALSLNQTLFSEPTNAALEIEKYQQLGRVAEHRQNVLDVILNSTQAFLNLLQAKTKYRIQKDHLHVAQTSLELAQGRVKAGSTSKADIYRWESEVAQARINLISDVMSMQQAEELLNYLLNLPLTQRFTLDERVLDDPLLLINDPQLQGLIDSPEGMDNLAKALGDYALKQAPEIAILEANIVSQKRLLQSEKRSRWLPDVGLAGEVSHTYHDNRLPDFSVEGDSDWRVSLNMSLPLFEGGANSSRIRRANLTLSQLKTELEDTMQRSRQQVQANVYTSQASSLSIRLKRLAAESARKNYEMEQDLYRSGKSRSLDLVDAQNQFLTAQLDAASADYIYLSDLMSLQRSIGAFDFFLNETERNDIINSIKKAMILKRE